MAGHLTPRSPLTFRRPSYFRPPRQSSCPPISHFPPSLPFASSPHSSFDLFIRVLSSRSRVEQSIVRTPVIRILILRNDEYYSARVEVSKVVKSTNYESSRCRSQKLEVGNISFSFFRVKDNEFRL